eukprot:6262762-Pyramimonas_sp.AAC.1
MHSTPQFARWVYAPPPLLRLVLTVGIYRLPLCDWFSAEAAQGGEAGAHHPGGVWAAAAEPSLDHAPSGPARGAV